MIDPLDVLALLEEKPYTEAELLTLFETSRQILTFALKALKRDGRVTRDGNRWALASVRPPAAPARTTKPARMLPDVEDDTEPVDDVEDEAQRDMDAAEADLDTALVDAEPPPQRVRGQRRLYPRTTDAAGSPLRQAHRRAAAPTDQPPSWWVGLSRDQLAAGIAVRAEGMRGTKENLKVPLRMLQ